MRDDLRRLADGIADIAPGQVWELCSRGEHRWVRVIVSKVEDGLVTLRYEAVLEFITLDLAELQDPERFRPTI